MPRSKKTEEEKKYDLTINVNVNLLNKVDSIIEKNGDKRSRLIERLLIEYVENNKNKFNDYHVNDYFNNAILFTKIWNINWKCFLEIQ